MQQVFPSQGQSLTFVIVSVKQQRLTTSFMCAISFCCFLGQILSNFSAVLFKLESRHDYKHL